jgi:hypothetical protein
MEKAKLVSVDWVRVKRIIRAFFAVCWLLILFVCIAVIISNIDRLKGVRVNSQLLLDYINALKWPLLILFFGLFFQRPIRKFLNEAESVETKAGKVTRRPAQQTAEPNELRNSAPDADEPATDGTQVVDSEDADLEEKLTSPEAVAEYQRIYKVILGSQFEALKKLDSFRDGLAERDLQEFVELHKNKFGEGGYGTVNELMAYPVSELLAKYNPADNLYFLTYAGLYFLNYIRGRGLGDRELLF